MAPASPSAPRRRTKRVSAQHTLERVRNNQRRHRARQKDHVTTLEQKLIQAEQTISALRDQVEALQAASAVTRSPPPLINTHGEVIQAHDALSDTEDLGAWELPVPTFAEPQVSGDQPGLEVDALISPPTESPLALFLMAQASEFVPEPPPVTESASDQEFAEVGSLLPAAVIRGPILPPEIHLIDPSLDSQPTFDKPNPMDLVLGQDNALLMRANLFQPGIEACSQASHYGESTMLCSEAYTLIAQRNFKGISQGDVFTWLWNSFRRSRRPGEGCRVDTDMLFSLLAFISDV